MLVIFFRSAEGQHPEGKGARHACSQPGEGGLPKTSGNMDSAVPSLVAGGAHWRAPVSVVIPGASDADWDKQERRRDSQENQANYCEGRRGADDDPCRCCAL